MLVHKKMYTHVMNELLLMLCTSVEDLAELFSSYSSLSASSQFMVHPLTIH